MDLTAWVLYLLIAAAVIGAALLHYRFREPKGRGRRLLALLRGLALAGLVLLLFNPRVPAGRPGAPSVLALVDGSLSMTLPGASGETAWRAARSAVRALAPDRMVLVGDEGGRVVTTLDNATPDAVGSRLAPALRAAAEAGTDRVVVLTDGAVEDPTEVRRVRDAAAGVEIRRMGGERAFNAGLVGLTVPGWARVGETARVTVSVGRVGVDAPDTVDVALRRGSRELARRRLETPPAGREATAELTFTPREGSTGPVRLDVVLEGGGSIADDDRRSVYLRISDDPAGVAVVSLLPDQEPRFLMPVLARASGLPVRGWAAVTAGRWVRIGAGSDAGRLEPTEAPRGALEQADIVVLHGLGEDAPEWAVEAVQEAERVLVFPADGARGLPFDPGPVRTADWYVSDAVPGSPVAPLLAGARTAELPPLTALRTPAVEDFWAPLMARPGRRDEARPVLLAGRVDARRVAVALGDGYWRWAFAGDRGRALYDRLWSAVIGWLSAAEPAPERRGVEPVDRVVPRGTPSRWRVPGDVDSVRIRLEPTEAPEVIESAAGRAGEARDRTASPDSAVDRTVRVREGIAILPTVPPGHYRYTAEADTPGEAGATGEGEITVSWYSPEFTRPATLEPGPERAREGRARRGASEPLRSTPWGYLAVLLVLSMEWVLRRRWGLR